MYFQEENLHSKFSKNLKDTQMSLYCYHTQILVGLEFLCHNRFFPNKFCRRADLNTGYVILLQI